MVDRNVRLVNSNQGILRNSKSIIHKNQKVSMQQKSQFKTIRMLRFCIYSTLLVKKYQYSVKIAEMDTFEAFEEVVLSANARNLME